MPHSQIRDAVTIRVFLVIREQIDVPSVIVEAVDRLGSFTHMPGPTDLSQVGWLFGRLDEPGPAPDRHQAARQKLPP